MSPSRRSTSEQLQPAPAETAGALQRAEILETEEWHDKTEEEIAVARAEGVPLAGIFADIAGLKAVNDEIGHDAGNELIAVASNIITSIPGAKVGRLGGDEFGVLLPGFDEDRAHETVSYIRSAFDAHVNQPGNEKLQELGAGISLGMTPLEDDMEASDFWRAADQAMYDDKLSQLRVLTSEEEVHLRHAIESLNAAGVRLRDVPKYIELIGLSILKHGESED